MCYTSIKTLKTQNKKHVLCNCELRISPLKGICKCSALVPYGCHLHVYCN